MEYKLYTNIKNNPGLLYYIRLNPKWYKILDQNPELFSEFEKQYKIDNKLDLSSKINKLNNSIKFFTEFSNFIKDK